MSISYSKLQARFGKKSIQLLIVLSVGLILLGGWRLLSSFPVDTIRVTAAYQHVSQAELQEIITPYVGQQGLLRVDLPGLHRKLERIPWIDSVFLYRMWPGTMVIELQEKIIEARWNDEWLLTKEGEVLPAKPGMAMIPQLMGPEGKHTELLHEYQNMSKLLAPLGVTIVRLEWSPFDTWFVVLDNNITLVLGNVQLESRLRRFVDVYPQIVSTPHAHPQRVDLRYPNAMAIYWNENNV